MTTDRLITAAWVIGFILIVLSWIHVVPEEVYWVGLGISMVAFIVDWFIVGWRRHKNRQGDEEGHPN